MSRNLPETLPAWQIERWFNCDAGLELDSLRGRVVVIEAFQMLCPGCVSHALPQAARVHALFPRDQVQVVGLHTVFEHHRAMGPEALAAFLHEYRIVFPVAIDAHLAADPIPATMRAWQIEGTPTLLLIDRAGRLRLKHFGRLDDLRLGAEIMRLVAETERATMADAQESTRPGCSEDGCALP